MLKWLVFSRSFGWEKVDKTQAADLSLDPIDNHVWNNPANLYGWTSYLGEAPGAPELAPYASAARRDDLSGLPPAWLYVSDIELFHDETRAYADRLENSGVPTTFHLVEGAPHAFELFTRGAMARSLHDAARSWLRNQLGLARPH